MSQSPGVDSSDDEELSEEAASHADEGSYARAWAAIRKLMRRGLSWSGHERHCAFLNLADGTFANVSSSSGFDFEDDGRALATIDWDHDGDLDLLVTQRNGPRVRFVRNEGKGGRGVTLLLRGVECNRDAVGARVAVRCEDGSTIVRAVRAGEGYLAQSSAWVHAGSGGRAIEEVVVHWPGGEAEGFSGVETGGAFVLTQGAGRAQPFAPGAGTEAPERSLRADSEAAPDAPAGANDGGSRRVVLSSAVPMPSLVVRTPDGGERTLFGIRPGGGGAGTGRAVLVNLFASTCAPCARELAELAAHIDELEAANLTVLVVSAEEDAEAAAASLRQLGWPRAWAIAPPETLDLLDALHGALVDTEVRLPVPTSFLVDREGLLRAIYVGRTSVPELEADRALLSASPEHQLRAAVPFAGTWSSAPVFDPAFFAGRLRRRGLADAAAEYERAAYVVVNKSRAQLLHDMGRERAAAGELDAATAAMRRAIQEDPEFFPARYDLAQLLHRRGDLHDAIAAYRAARELEPEHVELGFNLGLAFLGTLQLASAEREVEALRAAESPLAAELAQLVERVRAETQER